MAGPASQFSYGWQEAVFAAMETAYGAPITPAPDDAIRVLRSQFAHARERAPRRDKRGSRSVLAMVTGREAAAWQIEKYLVPSGVAGTAPDDGVLWRLLFGSERVTPGCERRLWLDRRALGELFALPLQRQRHGKPGGRRADGCDAPHLGDEPGDRGLQRFRRGPRPRRR